jgi:hypothetical protein
MSADDTSDDARKRLDRLKAMQSRHLQHQPAEEPAVVQGAAATPVLPARRQPPKAQGQAGEGGRPAILQKVRQALSGPDGKIDSNRARMLISFVRKQAADPSAPRHELAKKIEGILSNMPPQQRQKLMAVAGLGGGSGGANRAAGARRAGAVAPDPAAPPQEGAAPTGEAWFDNFVGKL